MSGKVTTTGIEGTMGHIHEGAAPCAERAADHYPGEGRGWLLDGAGRIEADGRAVRRFQSRNALRQHSQRRAQGRLKIRPPLKP